MARHDAADVQPRHVSSAMPASSSSACCTTAPTTARSTELRRHRRHMPMYALAWALSSDRVHFARTGPGMGNRRVRGARRCRSSVATRSFDTRFHHPGADLHHRLRCVTAAFFLMGDPAACSSARCNETVTRTSRTSTSREWASAWRRSASCVCCSASSRCSFSWTGWTRASIDAAGDARPLHAEPAPGSRCFLQPFGRVRGGLGFLPS